VEGGSCNDYDYVCGDPVNRFDVTGECLFGKNPNGSCRGSGAARHVTFSLSGCIGGCASVTFQAGHFQVAAGGIGFGGRGASVGLAPDLKEQGNLSCGVGGGDGVTGGVFGGRYAKGYRPNATNKASRGINGSGTGDRYLTPSVGIGGGIQIGCMKTIVDLHR